MHKKNESSYKEFLTISVLVRDMILMLHFVTIQERKDLATEHKNSKKSEKYDWAPQMESCGTGNAWSYVWELDTLPHCFTSWKKNK